MMNLNYKITNKTNKIINFLIIILDKIKNKYLKLNHHKD
jgi:hypothetical protein